MKLSISLLLATLVLGGCATSPKAMKQRIPASAEESLSLSCEAPGPEEFEGFKYAFTVFGGAPRISQEQTERLESAEYLSLEEHSALTQNAYVYVSGLENGINFFRNDVLVGIGNGLREDCTVAATGREGRVLYSINLPGAKHVAEFGEGDSSITKRAYIFSYNRQSKQGILCAKLDYDGNPVNYSGTVYTCTEHQ